MCVEKEMTRQTAERLSNAVDLYSLFPEQEDAIREAIAAEEPVSPDALRHELSQLKTRNDGVADENQGDLLAAALSLVHAKQGNRPGAYNRRKRLEEANQHIDSFFERSKPKDYRHMRSVRHSFCQFLKRLNACPAETGDSPTFDAVKVSRTDALDAFLHENPTLKCFREHLAVVHILGSPDFLFRKDLWDELRRRTNQQ